MSYGSNEFMDDVIDCLSPSGLLGDEMATDDCEEQAEMVCQAIIKAWKDRAALLIALRGFVAWADRNDWGTVPKATEAKMRAAIAQAEQVPS